MGSTEELGSSNSGGRQAREPRCAAHSRRGGGTFEDLDFDAVADLRLAVDEACTRLIRCAVPESTLLLVVDSRDDAVVIDASTTCKSPDILAPGSFSWHVLSSLTDEVRTFQNGQGPEENQVFGISMTTRRASSLQ